MEHRMRWGWIQRAAANVTVLHGYIPSLREGEHCDSAVAFLRGHRRDSTPHTRLYEHTVALWLLLDVGETPWSEREL